LDLLAIILFSVLAFIAAVHFYWAFGGIWPGKDETSLARTVVGEKDITQMPSMSLGLLVAALILAASLWPMMWRSLVPFALLQDLVWLGMIVLSIVFLGRGIAGYLPFFKKHFCEQPFARLNRLYFSPLCLIIGTGFVVLLLNV